MRPRGQGDPDALIDLLPHRPPALLVTEVIEHVGRTATLAGRIPHGHPYVAEGRVSALLVVDFAAQAAGVLIGLLKATETEDLPHPELGFLVGLRETRLFVPEVCVDQALEARVRLEAQMGDLATFSFTVTLDGEEAAEGRLSLSTPA